MKRFERILVCIDEPDRDAKMLDAVGHLCRVASTKQVHLVHVSRSDDLTVDADALQELAADRLTDLPDAEVICDVVVGEPLVELLRYGHEQSIDLIIVGRWREGEGAHKRGAVLARRLAAKATCSVAVLPDDVDYQIKKIVAPVRDSECSANALDVACGIAARHNAELVCLNIFPVHSGYRSVGTSLEEHVELLEKAAREETEQLIGRVDTQGAKISINCVADMEGDPVPIILEQVKELPAEVVVIGARGRTGAAGVLLGAVTEDLIRSCPVSVVAVKKKGECVTLLQAILSLM